MIQRLDAVDSSDADGNDRHVNATPNLDVQAVVAWRKLSAEHVKPTSIHFLQREHPDKAVVCRLVGAGTAGNDIVAKRSDRETAATECLIYERVLPHLPIRTLRYYGAVVDDDNRYHWLFLEDAGGEPYRPDLQDHRVLAGDWLGALHGSAQRVPSIDGLASREGSFYLNLLRLTRDSTLRLFEYPVLAGCDRAPLEAILRHFDVLQQQWLQVERFCERLPRTLVHGDLGWQNARVRLGCASNSLLVMDWENAGWGIPAVDLAQSGASLSPDVTTYWSAVSSYWPTLELTDILRMASYGSMFRLINAVAWANQSFLIWLNAHTNRDSPEWYLSDVQYVEVALANWIETHLLHG